MKSSFEKLLPLYLGFCIFVLPSVASAQALTGRISDTIARMITVLNVLIVGAVAWSGFLLVKGESSAVTRLLYCVGALVVVNSARLIIDYFL